MYHNSFEIVEIQIKMIAFSNWISIRHFEMKWPNGILLYILQHDDNDPVDNIMSPLFESVLKLTIGCCRGHSSIEVFSSDD